MSETFNDQFKKLYKESGVKSEKEFSERYGINRNTVAKYRHATNTLPDAGVINTLCESFGVSADWLIGRTGIRSPDPQLQAVCDYIGLNENTVYCLHTQNNPKLKSILDELICSGLGRLLLSLIERFLTQPLPDKPHDYYYIADGQLKPDQGIYITPDDLKNSMILSITQILNDLRAGERSVFKKDGDTDGKS